MRSWIGTTIVVLLVMLIAVGLVTVLFLVAFVTPEHNAMAPGILRGDGLITWRIGEPGAGDIVLFERPDEPSRSGVSRVVAVGPTTVELDTGGALVRIGEDEIEYGDPGPFEWEETRPEGALERTRDAVQESLPSGARYRILRPGRKDPIPKTGSKPVEVPAGNVFVLNDNRGAPESDSRSFGVVPLDHVDGVVRWYSSAGPTVTDAPRGEVSFGAEVR